MRFCWLSQQGSDLVGPCPCPCRDGAGRARRAAGGPRPTACLSDDTKDATPFPSKSSPTATPSPSPTSTQSKVYRECQNAPTARGAAGPARPCAVLAAGWRKGGPHAALPRGRVAYPADHRLTRELERHAKQGARAVHTKRAQGQSRVDCEPRRRGQQIFPLKRRAGSTNGTGRWSVLDEASPPRPLSAPLGPRYLVSKT